MKTLDEARLPDVLIDLHDHFGASFPKPKGLIVQFTVVAESTTYQRANRTIQDILTKHGLNGSKVHITPGPEVPLANRRIVIEIARDLLL